MNIHLTHEQLFDLILADSSLPHEAKFESSLQNSDVVHAHLQACLICSAELKSLRDSLSHFRDASVAYSRHEFAQSYAQRSIAPPHSYLSQPLYWAAAVVVFVAALFPLSLRQNIPNTHVNTTATSASSRAAESDEALLADIDQKLSADVPSPMNPLVDPLSEPTAGAAATTSTSDQRSN
jgi:hypothetical protein